MKLKQKDLTGLKNLSGLKLRYRCGDKSERSGKGCLFNHNRNIKINLSFFENKIVKIISTINSCTIWAGKIRNLNFYIEFGNRITMIAREIHTQFYLLISKSFKTIALKKVINSLVILFTF